MSKIGIFVGVVGTIMNLVSPNIAFQMLGIGMIVFGTILTTKKGKKKEWYL